MQIEGDKWLVKRAVCFARALNVYGFDLKITQEEDGSWCSRAENGSFRINIEPSDRYWALRALAHEMVHLKQYKHDELIDVGEAYVWKGKNYHASAYMSDEYFLAPWEMEARALEAWLVHKWETRKNELH